MRSTLLTLVLGAVLSLSASAQEAPPPGPALKGFDPVELVRGKEVPGSKENVVRRGAYTYAFASVENRKVFEQDPERYSIQFGGACTKMGPLSGNGHPDRFSVFEGKIYIFASDSCEAAFRRDPKRFADTVDSPPAGGETEAKAAEALLRKAVEAIGGAESLKALSTVEVRYRMTQTRREKTTTFHRVSALRFPTALVVADDYGDYKESWFLTPEGGFTSWGDGVPVEESVRQFMERELYRHPVALLRAWQAGEAKAVHAGSRTLGEKKVELVAVAVRGATTTLGVDPADGRVLGLSYRGRYWTPGIAQVEKAFSDFRKVGPLTLPHAEAATLDGKPLESLKIAVESIRVNEPLAPELFAKPAPAGP